MVKKDELAGVIETLEKHRDLIPSDLMQTIRKVKENIQGIPEDKFELMTNHVVTQTPDQQDFEPRFHLYQMTEGYSELKRIAEQHRDAHPELLSAVNRIRGLFEASEGFFPE